MNMDNLSSIGVTIGGGFFAGILIGYALKKVVKVVAIVVGLFFAGLAYLQYPQIVAINWNKVPQLSQNVVTTIANAVWNSGSKDARDLLKVGKLARSPEDVEWVVRTLQRHNTRN